MSGQTILLVEDDPDDVRFLKRAFAKAGLECRLSVADDGQRAVEHLLGRTRPEGPAASHVLLDLKLPRKSGLEVLAWIRNHPTLRALPVIILTSSEVRSDMEQARALGIDAFLVKPLTTSGLEDVVKTIASRWKLDADTPTPSPS